MEGRIEVLKYHRCSSLVSFSMSQVRNLVRNPYAIISKYFYSRRMLSHLDPTHSRDNVVWLRGVRIPNCDSTKEHTELFLHYLYLYTVSCTSCGNRHKINTCQCFKELSKLGHVYNSCILIFRFRDTTSLNNSSSDLSFNF